jgi:hypothetical protein
MMTAGTLLADLDCLNVVTIHRLLTCAIRTLVIYIDPVSDAAITTHDAALYEKTPFMAKPHKIAGSSCSPMSICLRPSHLHQH